jgi:hypothetical protein
MIMWLRPNSSWSASQKCGDPLEEQYGVFRVSAEVESVPAAPRTGRTPLFHFPIPAIFRAVCGHSRILFQSSEESSRGATNKEIMRRTKGKNAKS